jgi:hypothetical protein
MALKAGGFHQQILETFQEEELCKLTSPWTEKMHDIFREWGKGGFTDNVSYVSCAIPTCVVSSCIWHHTPTLETYLVSIWSVLINIGRSHLTQTWICFLQVPTSTPRSGIYLLELRILQFTKPHEWFQSFFTWWLSSWRIFDKEVFSKGPPGGLVQDW